VAVNAILDVFAGSAFDMASLTTMANRTNYSPLRVGKRGIFSTRGINTTKVALDRLDGRVTLIPNTQRGSVSNQFNASTRRSRDLVVPHLPTKRTISPSDVQNLRRMGEATPSMESLDSYLQGEQQKLRGSHDATLEYQRVGAIKGILLDSDGTTTVTNLFTDFGISQPTSVIALATSTTDVLGRIQVAVNLMLEGLGDVPSQGAMAYCGVGFFNALRDHPKVRDTLLNAQDAETLRNGTQNGFWFGGVWWEPYYGGVNGVSYIPSAEAQLFPLGTSGVFETVFAPADKLEFVNTTGLPLYSWMVPGAEARSMDLIVESNPLSYCTVPECLVKLTQS
jgi:hypothetical protein